MRQLVGLPCTLCQKRIGSISEGGFCPDCGCPVHKYCVGNGPRPPENCQTCGSPAPVVAEQQRLEQKDATELTEAVQAEWGSRLIGSGLLTLFGGVGASLFCFGLTAGSGAGGAVVFTGAIVGGLVQIITGIVVLVRAAANRG